MVHSSTAPRQPAVAGRRRAVRQAHGVPWVLPLAAATLMMLFLSNYLLAELGVPYSLEGGNPLVKIHPSTYLLFAMALLILSRSGNPVAGLQQFAQIRPQYFAYVVCVLLLSVYLVILQGTSGIAFVVDSLLRPGLVALILVLVGEGTRRRLFPFCVTLVGINAVIGIAEVLLEVRLVPYTNEGVPVIESHFRATALIGHPLLNAIVTATTMMVAVGYLKGWGVRFVIIVTHCLGLLAFGGRTAFVIGIAMLVLLAMLRTAHELLTRHVTHFKAIAAIVMMLVVPALFFVAIGSLGLGERIVEGFQWDSSAQARLHSFDLLSYLTVNDLVFGISSSRFIQYLDQLYLLETVENFWIILLARFGLIGFVPFLVALIFFLYRLMRDGGQVGWIVVLGFLVIASSNNSLASKNPALSMLVLLILAGSAYARHATVRRRRPVPAAAIRRRPRMRT